MIILKVKVTEIIGNLQNNSHKYTNIRNKNQLEQKHNTCHNILQKQL